MAVYTRTLLSGSTNGKPIPVAATSTPGTLIHTAIAGTSAIDMVSLWAENVTNAPATLTIEWGGVSDPGDHLVHAYSLVPNSPPEPIATGIPLQNGLAIRAFSGTGSAINISGYVNRVV